MAKQTKYGVISDVHKKIGLVPYAIKLLKSLNVDKLLVNGDILERQNTLSDSQNYIGFILDEIGKSGLESFVQPGSHETLFSYRSVIDHFSQKFPNIIDVTKNQKFEMADHDLVFLPGSDFLCGGEFQIGDSENLPSGKYINAEDSLYKFDHLEQYVHAINNEIAQGAFQYFNMNDLRQLVTSPEKTIMVCHVPRKFDNLETCVDFAEFGLALEKFVLNSDTIEKGSVFPSEVGVQLARAGYPVNVLQENRGNIDLKNIYEELGIKKAVTGHFHEASHRANDRQGNHVDEGKLVDELFWNASYLDEGRLGILTVEGEKVRYQNINLTDYI